MLDVYMHIPVTISNRHVHKLWKKAPGHRLERALGFQQDGLASGTEGPVCTEGLGFRAWGLGFRV